MIQPGTKEFPLRVAIVGSGPSGFYAAEHLLKQTNLTVEVDMYDRLPTPYGLVRGGVAPDHQKIKSVTKVYERTASKPNFRFYGNVEFGKDIQREDLHDHYHSIIYAVGAQTDKQLNIPGEDLSGSHPATDFVAWYNAHPDYRHLEFDLSQERVAVIGVGNVAMDVVRILARSYDELKQTDIADYALEALRKSKVKEIYLLGRRGPAQAAFTNPEIKELGEMEDADIIIAPDEVELDPYSKQFLDETTDRTARRNVEILTNYSKQNSHHKARKIFARFLVSPTEILGTDSVEAIRIVKNELYQSERGDIRPRATDKIETLPVGLVFRSVGYRGIPLPDVPFYDAWGIIPNDKGRVLTEFKTGEPVLGEYVVGWIKRGPSGVIGTNKPDAVETVNMLLEDVENEKFIDPPCPVNHELVNLLKNRKIRYVTFEDWQKIDAIELERGQAQNRPRVKFSTVEEMLKILDK